MGGGGEAPSSTVEGGRALSYALVGGGGAPFTFLVGGGGGGDSSLPSTPVGLDDTAGCASISDSVPPCMHNFCVGVFSFTVSTMHSQGG